eukprot:5326007-Amphidinium_carterae.5
MAPKAKPKAKTRAKPKAGFRARGLPDLPAPLVPDRWYVLPGAQDVVEQLRTGQLVQVEEMHGTLLAEVIGAHPRDGAGLFLEVGFRGGSTDQIQSGGTQRRAKERTCCCTSAPQLVAAARMTSCATDPSERRHSRGADRKPVMEILKVKALRDRVLALKGEEPGGVVAATSPAQANAILDEAEKALREEERAACRQRGDAAGAGVPSHSQGQKKTFERKIAPSSQAGSIFIFTIFIGLACYWFQGQQQGTLHKMREYLSLRDGGVSIELFSLGSTSSYCYYLSDHRFDAINGGVIRPEIAKGTTYDSAASGGIIERRYCERGRMSPSKIQGSEAECAGGVMAKRKAPRADPGAESHGHLRSRETSRTCLRKSRIEDETWWLIEFSARLRKQSEGGESRWKRRAETVGLGTRPGSSGQAHREATPGRTEAHYTPYCSEDRSRSRASRRSSGTEPSTEKESAAETQEESRPEFILMRQNA